VLRPACNLNQELALFRRVRSAAPRLLLLAEPPSLESAVKPSRTWSFNQ